MKKLVTIFCLLIVAIAANASVLQYKLNTPVPQTKASNGFTAVSLPGGVVVDKPGYPALPAMAVNFVLPYGEQITKVEVTGDFTKIQLQDPVYPAQQQYPISEMPQVTFTQPDQKVYSSSVYPNKLYKQPNTGYLRGYAIASLCVSPLVYHPLTKVLEYCPSLDIKVYTEPAGNYLATRFLRNDQKTYAQLQELVVNPQRAYAYPGGPVRTGDEYDYLIITADDFIDNFEQLADYKNSVGIKTEVHSLTDIYAQYTGNDAQEKLRAFIINQYDRGIDYVLLAADADILPERGFSVQLEYNDPDDDIASDLYYSCLDGTWNDDNDLLWGEWAEADLYAELSIGRAAVGTTGQAAAFVNKQIMYQQSPVVADLTNNLLVGEDLGWTMWGKHFLEEVRLGSSNYGYTTAGIPSNINTDTLYDYDAVWSSYDLLNKLNSGKNLVGHLGHSDVTYTMKMNNSTVNTSRFTNNGTNHNFYVLYTQGCYCNSFDNRNTDGSTNYSDAISENLTNLANGPVAFIGNTRYGWGDGSQTNGASQHLMREFYDALYGEDITVMGDAHRDSQLDMVSFLTASSVNLWAFYEITILGDPTLDIWTATPATVSANLPESMVIGTNGINVTVTEGDNFVAGARVTAMYNQQPLASAVSADNGIASLQFNTIPQATGTLTINVSGHNIARLSQDIALTEPDGPYLVPGDVTVESSSGVLDPGQTAYINVPLKNIGSSGASGVSAMLFTDSPYITVNTSDSVYPDIDAGATANPSTQYQISVADDVPIGTTVTLSMFIFGTEGSWQYNIQQEIASLGFDFIQSGFGEATGNGNSSIEPGETVSANFVVLPKYPGLLEQVDMRLTCDNPMVTIEPELVTYNNVTSADHLTLENVTVTLSGEIYPLAVVPVYLEINANNGFVMQKVYNIVLQGFNDSFETEFYSWSHGGLSGNGDQWHRTSTKNHTPNGTYSYKCGATGSSEYDADLLASLETPYMTLSNDVSLNFWHSMDAELDTSNSSQCYDGGYVQASTDGANWIDIAPTGGYPCTALGGSNSNVPTGKLMFSGSTGWQQVVFGLSELPANASQVKFRFVFASDGYVAGNGWFIDDVSLAKEQQLLPPVNLAANGNENGVLVSWQSPQALVDYYRVYRNDALVADEVTFNQMHDEVAYGTTCSYTVTTVYNGVESDESDAAVVTWTDADDNAVAPKATSLSSNYPNPFNPTTTIKFNLANGGQVDLIVYNLKGQKVKTLVNGQLAKGAHSVTWRGQDDNGRPVASGIYLYKMKSGRYTSTKKMILLK